MWEGWPLSRILLLFTGGALLMVSLQVTLFHSRQNFRHWAMYAPVVAGPILALLTIGLAFYNVALLRAVTGVLLFGGVALGAAGGYIHINGIGERVGGFGETQNFLTGPPPTLPLMVLAMSVLGLLALYWR